MSVGAAAGLLGSGAIGDDYGRRLTFLSGTVMLGLASLSGALAPNALTLIIARVVQGLGGAAILACGLGLIGQVYPDKALAHATAIWAAALGAGVAIGPILAAWLAALGGWAAPYWFSGRGRRRFCSPSPDACPLRNHAPQMRGGLMSREHCCWDSG